MEFEYTDTVYILEEDIEKMVKLASEVLSQYSIVTFRTKIEVIQTAISTVAAKYDDAYFYEIGKIEDQLIFEICNRIKKEENKK